MAETTIVRRPNRKPTRPRARQLLAKYSQLAIETGVPATTWADLVAKGELPSIRIGRVHWVVRADAHAYIARGRKTQAINALFKGLASQPAATEITLDAIAAIARGAEPEQQ